MVITKEIHQTISSSTNLPSSFIAKIEQLRRDNEGWVHNIYEEKDRQRFISSYYGKRILRLYAEIDPAYGAAKADLFRYLVLYEKGGVYLDVKSTAKKPLSQIISPRDEFITSEWNQTHFPGWGKWPHFGVNNELQQWFLMSAPKHPILKSVIERVVSNLTNYDPLRNGIGRLGVLLNTGPIPYTLAVREQMRNSKVKVIDSYTEGLVFSFPLEMGIDHSIAISSNYRRAKVPLMRRNWPKWRLLASRVNRKGRYWGLTEPSSD